MADAQLTQSQPIPAQAGQTQANSVAPTLKPVGFLQDGDGNLSSTRLAFLLWAVGVLAVWMIVSVKSGALATVPQEVIAVLGVVMTGKVVQKFGE